MLAQDLMVPHEGGKLVTHSWMVAIRACDHAVQKEIVLKVEGERAQPWEREQQSVHSACNCHILLLLGRHVRMGNT
jgi:hypothetical protein